MNNGMMIAVWGNGGSGKTTTAIKLATELANQKKEVIVVLTDNTAPDMQLLLPYEKEKKTMGYLWSTPNCNSENIYSACVVTKSDYLCLLGYLPGENVFSFPDYTKESIVKIYMELRSIADYVIVDCASEFVYNVLTTVALEMADKVIRLGEATSKAFSFFDSNLPLLSDSRYKKEEHIRVLSKVKSYQPREVAIGKLGMDIELPFAQELELQMIEGELFHTVLNKNFTDYYSSLKKLVQLVVNEDSELKIKKKAPEIIQNQEVIKKKGKKKEVTEKKVKDIVLGIKRISLKIPRKRSDIIE